MVNKHSKGTKISKLTAMAFLSMCTYMTYSPDDSVVDLSDTIYRLQPGAKVLVVDFNGEADLEYVDHVLKEDKNPALVTVPIREGDGSILSIYGEGVQFTIWTSSPFSVNQNCTLRELVEEMMQHELSKVLLVPYPLTCHTATMGALMNNLELKEDFYLRKPPTTAQELLTIMVKAQDVANQVIRDNLPKPQAQ